MRSCDSRVDVESAPPDPSAAGASGRFAWEARGHLFRQLISGLCVRACSLTVRAQARWWGVQIGRRCRFYGLPLLYRWPDSRIRIGAECVFRSGDWSNTMGLNRRCILSTCGRGAVLEIGQRCGFSGAVICAARRVRIGDRVLCGANVTVTDTDRHPVDPVRRADGLPGEAAGVRIEDDVWLAMNVAVLKGVTIGEAAVIAANSVVASDIPAGVLAGGIPARVIRSL